MKFPAQIPFVQALGLELLHVGDGEAEIALEVAAAHLNSFQVAHGGVIMSMLDVAMAHAARSVNRDQSDFGPGVVTIEMKTSFMQPGEGRLRAFGKLLTRTATLAFVEGRILDAEGTLLAHATGTFKYLRALPAGRRTKPLSRHLDGPGSD